MDISYVIWGMLFGYLAMPTGKNTALSLLSSYGAALVIALGFAYVIKVGTPVWLFLVGLIGQFGLFALYYLAKHYLKLRSRN